MIEKKLEEKQNPFEELTKQFSDILGKVGANVQISPFPFTEDAKAEQEGKVPLEQVEDEEEALKRIRNFNLRPKEIKEYLDRFVISQEEAKKVLSVAICDHYNHIRNIIAKKSNKRPEYMKQNILILGPTGVGKTYLVKTIARLIGVPFVKADATKFSETGYVGGDVEDIVRSLIKIANGNVELAQYGIVFIDEIDKITNFSGEGGRDISGRGVQVNLLKLMEETDVSVLSQMDMLGQMRTFMSFGSAKKQQVDKINTKNILFIVSGAFDKLSDLVKKRVGTAQIGFSATSKSVNQDFEFLAQVQTEDFIQYGFEPEFIGRLPVRVACKALGEAELEKILSSSEDSIIKQYREDFEGYGIDLDFDVTALVAIAQEAAREKTGARGLLTILEHIFRDMKFELPSSTIRSISLDGEGVRNPGKYLEDILKTENRHMGSDIYGDMERFVETFEGNYGIRLNFTSQAREEVAKIALGSGTSIVATCNRLFEDFGYGLQLLLKDGEEKTFEISLEAVRDPDKFLSERITGFYKHLEQ
ncbi:MAG: ATP-dependent Clp protease ATP-binding subunit ClpX [Puniceicoccales bacterium]|jgi:endopeptidase Clp ATP-binding regulatory subunit ClpX|nr:ATP-dependent Clp protease ATP-binding subunit ClpX [Puniceicoccales bacterium]